MKPETKVAFEYAAVPFSRPLSLAPVSTLSPWNVSSAEIELDGPGIGGGCVTVSRRS